MTQQTTQTFTLFGLTFGLTFPKTTRTLAECKVPGAWPEDEPVLKIPGAWDESADENWCGHMMCWIENDFGFEHFCSRHAVVEVVLSGLKL